MATNLKIDPKLIDRAKRLGKMKTKRETVEAALQEYIGRRERLAILELAGTIEYLPGEDPLSRRQRERKDASSARRKAS